MTRVYFDMDFIRKMGIDDDIVGEVVGAYYESLVDIKHRLDHADELTDEEIRLEIHKVKGTASTVGDVELAEACLALDLKVKDGDALTIQEVNNVANMIGQSIDYLNAM